MLTYLALTVLILVDMMLVYTWISCMTRPCTTVCTTIVRFQMKYMKHPLGLSTSTLL